MRVLEREITVYRYNECMNVMMDCRRRMEQYELEYKSDEQKLKKINNQQKEDKEEINRKEKEMEGEQSKEMEEKLRIKKREIGIMEQEVNETNKQQIDCQRELQKNQTEYQNMVNSIPVIEGRIDQMERDKVIKEQEIESLQDQIE